MVSTDELQKGVETPCNIVTWRSGKLDRVCNSSMAAEAYSTVGALATAEWVMQCLGEMCNSAWDPHWTKRRLASWAEGPQRDASGMLILSQEGETELRKHMMVTDAKGLYDSIKAAAKSKEPRVALAVGEIQQSLQVMGMMPRWIPHNMMVADCMTKTLSKCHTAPMQQLLRTGVWQLHPEWLELQDRAKEKELQGRASRLKQHAAMK
eukprot:988697-Amphidinium_carterae.1